VSYRRVVTLTARTAGAAALALAFAFPSGAAHARGNDWTTVTTLAHARLQACKQPTTTDGPWQVRVRVNARKATKTVHGSAKVEQNGVQIGDGWKSGRVHPGEVSKVGVLKMPRGSAFRLDLQLVTGSSGTATDGPASLLHRC
jgi:hypothetical protein